MPLLKTLLRSDLLADVSEMGGGGRNKEGALMQQHFPTAHPRASDI